MTKTNGCASCRVVHIDSIYVESIFVRIKPFDALFILFRVRSDTRRIATQHWNIGIRCASLRINWREDGKENKQWIKIRLSYWKTSVLIVPNEHPRVFLLVCDVFKRENGRRAIFLHHCSDNSIFSRLKFVGIVFINSGQQLAHHTRRLVTLQSKGLYKPTIAGRLWHLIARETPTKTNHNANLCSFGDWQRAHRPHAESYWAQNLLQWKEIEKSRKQWENGFRRIPITFLQ